MNEDLVFDLEQPLIIPTDNNFQNRGNFKFLVDGDSLDWYNARLSLYFKLTKINGNNVIINDKNGIVNGASSFVKKISFSINGREVYQCNSANHVVNIKNLLEYNTSAETIASNEFYYLDTTIPQTEINSSQGESNTQEKMQTMLGYKEFLLKMKILLTMRGLIKERNNWEIQVLLIVKFLLIDIHFLRHLRIRCCQIPNLN